MQKRRLGLPFAGYSCNHVKPNGGTWHDTTSLLAEKMNCTQQYVSKVLKGLRESVIGNFVQNRKCIRYQNTTSWNK